MKKTLLTGLKPTGSLTLGNYIGSIKQMVDNQDKYNSYLFIADMHAITVSVDRDDLHKNIRDFMALYIACGVDPDKNVIYLQSDIEYIPAISWLLECNTYYGELSRMIQFKEKSKKNANFSVGLLTYPVLMATDILVVDADYVPVGIDQKQHVELSDGHPSQPLGFTPASAPAGSERRCAGNRTDRVRDLHTADCRGGGGYGGAANGGVPSRLPFLRSGTGFRTVVRPAGGGAGPHRGGSALAQTRSGRRGYPEPTVRRRILSVLPGAKLEPGHRAVYRLGTKTRSSAGAGAVACRGKEQYADSLR